MFTTKKESHKFKAKHVKKNTNDYKKKIGAILHI